MFNDLNEVRRANLKISRTYWFAEDAMQFFNTRIESPLLAVNGKQYFITSETPDETQPRGCAIREVLPDGMIRTVGNLRDYKTVIGAINAAKKVL